MSKTVLFAMVLGLISAQARAKTIPITEQTRQQGVRLGQGYDLRNGTFLERCWMGEIAYAGAQQAQIQLETSLQEEDVLRNISATFEGGADLLLVSGSIKTTVSSLFQGRRYRETLIYSVEYRGKNALLRDPTLRPDKATLRSRDPERFRAVCGDSFVTESLFGGQLYLFVHIDFLNQDQRDEFKTKVKVSALGFSKTKTISQDSGWTDRSAVVTIEATQIGGDPKYLTRLMSAHRNQCQLADMSGCEGMIDSLFRYATAEGGTAFPAQMIMTEFQNDQASEMQPALLAVKTQSVAPREARNNRDRGILAGRLSILEADESWLRQKISLYPKDSARSKDWQQFLASVLRPSKDRVLRMVYFCQVSAGNTCNIETMMPSSEWNNYLEVRGILEPDYGFVDACLVRSGDEGIEVTVSALLALWGHKNRTTAACEQVAQQLRSVKTLDLSGKQITRLEPLSEAVELEAIDLSRNNLQSIAVASRWKKLRWINLQTNQIVTLEPLRGLGLQHILAAYNRLRDVRSLSQNTYEKVLLHGNNFVTVDDVPLRAQTLVRSEAELCALQRSRLFEQGWISPSQLQAYSQANFLPVRVGEAVTIKPCSIAAPFFDVMEAQLFPERP
jgi:hypothetical protein